jgi:hypothetical protein
VPVKVKVEKLNPQVKVIFAGTNTLAGAGDEQTAVRFRLNATGEVLEMATRDKLLIRAEDFAGKQEAGQQAGQEGAAQ